MTDERPAHLDLLALVGVAVIGTLVLLIPGMPWPLEWAVAIPLVLVLPGYAILAAVFPATPATTRRESEQSTDGSGPATGRNQTPLAAHLRREDLASPNLPARSALAGMVLVSSVLVVALLGTLLSLLGALTTVAVVLVVAGTTIFGALLAMYRRQQRPPAECADPLSELSVPSLSGWMGLSRLQTVSLLLASIALVAALAVAGSSPGPQTGFSEASLAGGSDTGNFLGVNDSVQLVSGQETEVPVRLTNNESETVTYTVVGALQRVGPNGSVLESEPIDGAQVTLADGETGLARTRVDPSMTGESLRIQWLIYKGTAPADPHVETADLSLSLHVEVVDEGSA